MPTIKQSERSSQEKHHPRLELDEAIHQPVRLSIMSILAQAKKVDFAFLRDHLEIGDSNLSRHLTALESIHYIVVNKVFEGKRARTWLSLTQRGREAFDNHVRVLKQIVEHPIDNVEVPSHKHD
jgi:DNA-binding MarR family transcriptional regulator